MNTHHKEMKNRYKLLDFYYNVKYGMTPFCVGAELYIIAVYCRMFAKHEFIAVPFYWAFFLLFWGKFVCLHSPRSSMASNWSTRV